MHDHGDAVFADILLATHWLHLAATISLFGATMFPFYAGADARVTALPRRWIRTLAVMALVTAILWFAAEAGSMAGDWTAAGDPDTILAVLNHTVFGRIERWRILIALATVGCVFVPIGQDRGPGWALPLGAGLLLASLGLSGHTADAVGLGARLNQAAHLLAAGTWLGGLLPLGRLVAPTPEIAVPALRRFSAVGMSAIAVLVVTGVTNVLRLVQHWPNFTGVAWGRTLLVKLALFAALILLAALNRWRFMARLTEPTTRRHLVRSIAAEQVIGLALLAAASLLGSLEPP
jgi:putative copper resistance protein D